MSLRPWKEAYRLFVNKVKDQGFWVSFREMRDMHEIRFGGRLVGTDECGNKYYEDLEAQYGRHRWVVYANRDFDASRVPPLWHGWLHHSHDLPGDSPEMLANVQPKYSLPWRENTTGTDQQYVPDGVPLFSANYGKSPYHKPAGTTYNPAKPQPEDPTAGT